jgi:hypothetical protein
MISNKLVDNCFCNKHVDNCLCNIRKEKFEDAINRRTTNNTMVKIKVTKEQSNTGTKGQAINKALHKHLKLEQNEPH